MADLLDGEGWLTIIHRVQPATALTLLEKGVDPNAPYRVAVPEGRERFTQRYDPTGWWVPGNIAGMVLITHGDGSLGVPIQRHDVGSTSAIALVGSVDYDGVVCAAPEPCPEFMDGHCTGNEYDDLDGYLDCDCEWCLWLNSDHRATCMYCMYQEGACATHNTRHYPYTNNF